LRDVLFYNNKPCATCEPRFHLDIQYNFENLLKTDAHSVLVDMICVVLDLPPIPTEVLNEVFLLCSHGSCCVHDLFARKWDGATILHVCKGTALLLPFLVVDVWKRDLLWCVLWLG